MRRLILAALFASAILLAGCDNSSSLVGPTWFLRSVTARLPALQWDLPLRHVRDYTVTFNVDGTFTAKADCNELSGTYTTSVPLDISIVPGPSTMAFCGPDSHDRLYVGLLETAKNFAVLGNDLKLELADGGSLSYTSIEPASSESPGASQTATAAAATPTTKPTPTTEPTRAPSATPSPTATPKPTSGESATPKPTSGETATPKPTGAPTAGPTATPPAPSQGLLGKEWQLTAITIAEPPFQGLVDAANQPLYTITFNQDATFVAKADCNTLAGTYTSADPTASTGALTITPGPSSLVVCPAGSLSLLYMDALGQAASYAIADSMLTITLQDGGTLQYK